MCVSERKSERGRDESSETITTAVSRHEWHPIQTERGRTKKERMKPGRIIKGGEEGRRLRQ